ncbi:MAG TPA: hypothetical protein PK264_13775 [Hyphomicrobiaceae bacterium]|nr:hypothetical protein [Hyphomicrobiaceae bacterium]
MTTMLLLASALTIALGIAHSWIGEVRLIGPLLDAGTRSGILARSRFARQVLRFAWHITSLAWLGFAGMLIGFAIWPDADARRIALAVIGATMLLSGLIVLVMSRGRHLAWPLFLAIAGICAAATVQR